MATDSVGSTKRTLLTFTPMSHLDQARELVAAIQQLSLCALDRRDPARSSAPRPGA